MQKKSTKKDATIMKYYSEKSSGIHPPFMLTYMRNGSSAIGSCLTKPIEDADGQGLTSDDKPCAEIPFGPPIEPWSDQIDDSTDFSVKPLSTVLNGQPNSRIDVLSKLKTGKTK